MRLLLAAGLLAAAAAQPGDSLATRVAEALAEAPATQRGTRDVYAASFSAEGWSYRVESVVDRSPVLDTGTALVVRRERAGRHELYLDEDCDGRVDAPRNASQEAYEESLRHAAAALRHQE